MSDKQFTLRTFSMLAQVSSLAHLCLGVIYVLGRLDCGESWTVDRLLLVVLNPFLRTCFRAPRTPKYAMVII